MPRKSQNMKIKEVGEKIYSPASNAYLAPYASIPENSRGRLHKETEAPGRSVYQRDRDRIIHSAAFRRMEYKTQVFVYHEGDHYRTRLTHSLEVAQLARSVARELCLEEDLSEAIALAHDLGHTPFGHAGEDALCSVMKASGGFDHNAQAVRILTKLESKYAKFDGLNLTWECLEGIAKHNGPVTGDIPRAMKEYVKKHDLELNTYANLEAQLAAICDDIAYNNHDIEDGLRAGIISIKEIKELPLVGAKFGEVEKENKNIEEPRLIHEAKRRMISHMVADIVKTTKENIEASGVKSADDVRNYGKQLVTFSSKMEKENRIIKEYLKENLYKHYKVNRMTSKAKRVIKELFEVFAKEPECLPKMWSKQVLEAKDEKQKSIIIADFIAGMTDRFAFEEHRRLFDLSYRLIGE